MICLILLLENSKIFNLIFEILPIIKVLKELDDEQLLGLKLKYKISKDDKNNY